ncbi:MAG: hypothetical protein JXP34_03220 [Planctomycetes bacterium]|nr:hypothetical protein [Planctomycetota bacterium]
MRSLSLLSLLLLSPPAAAFEWRAGDPFDPDPASVENREQPDIGADPRGAFTIVWQSDGRDGSLLGIFGRRFARTGEPVGETFRANTTTSGSQRRPRIAMGAAGEFAIAWAGPRDTPIDVYAQRFDPGATPIGPEFRANVYTEGWQYDADVAIDDAGRVTIVWTSLDQDGDGAGVFARRFDPEGSPLGGEILVSLRTADWQYAPAVAACGDGGFCVAWTDAKRDGDGAGIFLQRFDAAGERLGDEIRVNETTGGDQITPDIASDPAGDLVVVWASRPPEETRGAILARRFDGNGDRIGGEFRVSLSNDAETPRVAMAPEGGFAITWGGSQEIRLRIFDAEGTPEGQEMVASEGPGIQPCIAMPEPDRVIVAWASGTALDPSHGIRARIFRRSCGGLFVRGNVNGGGIDLSDPVFILGYLFASGPAPACLDAADVDDSGVLDLADPVRLLDYLFASGDPPPPPFPDPGADPTDDGIPCDADP